MEMTLLGKLLAIFVFMVLPIGLFLLFGYFILRRIFKKDAYKSPFGKTGTNTHSFDHDDEFLHDSSGSSPGNNGSDDGASEDFGDSGDDD